MLNFRNTNIGFGICLAALIFADFRCDISWWWYLLCALVYSWVLFYGVYFIQSGFFIRTVYCAPQGRRSIALSFDDGPNPEYTPRVLDILRQHGVKAAFFCIGKNIASREPLLRQIDEEGHVIGNHSFTHNAWFDLFTTERMLSELEQTDQLIESVTGRRPAFFRPPYGVINPNVRDAVIRSGHTIIGWNVRSYDTMINDKHVLMRRLMRLIKPGAIVLMHEHGKQTLDVLPDFIEAVRAAGYAIEPLDHLVEQNAYRHQPLFLS